MNDERRVERPLAFSEMCWSIDLNSVYAPHGWRAEDEVESYVQIWGDEICTEVGLFLSAFLQTSPSESECVGALGEAVHGEFKSRQTRFRSFKAVLWRCLGAIREELEKQATPRPTKGASASSPPEQDLQDSASAGQIPIASDSGPPARELPHLAHPDPGLMGHLVQGRRLLLESGRSFEYERDILAVVGFGDVFVVQLKPSRDPSLFGVDSQGTLLWDFEQILDGHRVRRMMKAGKRVFFRTQHGDVWVDPRTGAVSLNE